MREILSADARRRARQRTTELFARLAHCFPLLRNHRSPQSIFACAGGDCIVHGTGAGAGSAWGHVHWGAVRRQSATRESLIARPTANLPAYARLPARRPAAWLFVHRAGALFAPPPRATFILLRPPSPRRKWTAGPVGFSYTQCFSPTIRSVRRRILPPSALSTWLAPASALPKACPDLSTRFQRRTGSDADENLPHRIVQAKYTLPSSTFVSDDCKARCRSPIRAALQLRSMPRRLTRSRILRFPQDMFAKIFVTDPNHRIAIEEIQQHVWYLRNLPPELAPVRCASRMSLGLRSLRPPRLPGLSIRRPEDKIDPSHLPARALAGGCGGAFGGDGREAPIARGSTGNSGQGLASFVVLFSAFFFASSRVCFFSRLSAMTVSVTPIDTPLWTEALAPVRGRDVWLRLGRGAAKPRCRARRGGSWDSAASASEHSFLLSFWAEQVVNLYSTI